MKLTVICPRVTRELRDIVSTLTAKPDVLIDSYELIDTISNEINKYFPAVLRLGNIDFDTRNCKLIWDSELPTASMSIPDKDVIYGIFKQIAETLKKHDDPTVFADCDIPHTEAFEKHLETMCGNVITTKLPDDRTLAIYPNGVKFENKYDIEIHFSRLVVVERIFRLFGTKEILVKED